MKVTRFMIQSAHLRLPHKNGRSFWNSAALAKSYVHAKESKLWIYFFFPLQILIQIFKAFSPKRPSTRG